ncbi:MAG: YtxH domain-containing protein [Desulfobulbaceae bacterium]|nr:YtxH domain-containing protein [Desulfobulbaceae bacterium]
MEEMKQTQAAAAMLHSAPGYYQAYPQQIPNNTTFLGLTPQNAQFWKGVALGATVTLLITNESVQKGLVKAVAKISAATQSGIEEMKEKFEDAKAEAIAEAGGK